MSERELEELHECQSLLHASGFDLLHWFSVQNLNKEVPPELALPSLECSAPVGLLIGNTKELWPVFLADLRAQLEAPAKMSDEELVHKAHRLLDNSLDDFVTRQIGSAVASVHASTWTGYAHVAEPRSIPMQRYAEASGFAPLGRGKLSLHLRHGPWIALRAVVVFSISERTLPDLSPTSLWTTASPCTACPAPCLSPPAEAFSDSTLLSALPAERKNWIQSRSACPLGQSSRYEDLQLFFHYRERSIPQKAD